MMLEFKLQLEAGESELPFRLEIGRKVVNNEPGMAHQLRKQYQDIIVLGITVLQPPPKSSGWMFPSYIFAAIANRYG